MEICRSATSRHDLNRGLKECAGEETVCAACHRDLACSRPPAIGGPERTQFHNTLVKAAQTGERRSVVQSDNM